MKKLVLIILITSRLLWSMDFGDKYSLWKLPKDLQIICFSQLVNTESPETIFSAIKELGRLRRVNKEWCLKLTLDTKQNGLNIICIIKTTIDREEIKEPDKLFCALFELALSSKNKGIIQILQENLVINERWITNLLSSSLRAVIHSPPGKSFLEAYKEEDEVRRFIFKIAGNNLIDILAKKNGFPKNVLDTAVMNKDFNFIKESIAAADDKIDNFMALHEFGDPLILVKALIFNSDGFINANRHNFLTLLKRGVHSTKIILNYMTEKALISILEDPKRTSAFVGAMYLWYQFGVYGALITWMIYFQL